MKVVVRDLGLVNYLPVWLDMQSFTHERAEAEADQLWCVEHEPVFTLGRASRPEHLLAPGDIPVVQSDRGGQVTYHGPGQLVVYTLLNVRRLGLGPRELVRRIESALLAYLAGRNISAERHPGAPGVYVGAAKIAALGLRIRGSYCYHGLALNVQMNLEPFQRINPCGYAGLKVTQLADHGYSGNWGEVQRDFLPLLTDELYRGRVYTLDHAPYSAAVASSP